MLSVLILQEGFTLVDVEIESVVMGILACTVHVIRAKSEAERADASAG